MRRTAALAVIVTDRQFAAVTIGWVLVSSATDGFRLGCARAGNGDRSVILLHGWPGDHTDFRKIIPLLNFGQPNTSARMVSATA